MMVLFIISAIFLTLALMCYLLDDWSVNIPDPINKYHKDYRGKDVRSYIDFSNLYKIFFIIGIFFICAWGVVGLCKLGSMFVNETLGKPLAIK